VKGKRGVTADSALDLAQALGTLSRGMDEPPDDVGPAPGRSAPQGVVAGPAGARPGPLDQRLLDRRRLTLRGGGVYRLAPVVTRDYTRA